MILLSSQMFTKKRVKGNLVLVFTFKNYANLNCYKEKIKKPDLIRFRTLLIVRVTLFLFNFDKLKLINQTNGRFFLNQQIFATTATTWYSSDFGTLQINRLNKIKFIRIYFLFVS